uniref:Uncharacterized protein n=1 Tax=Mycena chlorophos TaxID=658473 RepID=A0ABQ0LZS3_MYCCL|nr:predicted protein [Mycena chlorophos]
MAYNEPSAASTSAQAADNAGQLRSNAVNEQPRVEEEEMEWIDEESLVLPPAEWLSRWEGDKLRWEETRRQWQAEHGRGASASSNKRNARQSIEVEQDEKQQSDDKQNAGQKRRGLWAFIREKMHPRSGEDDARNEPSCCEKSQGR